MKIYISVDFEGMPAINSWDEVNASKPEFEMARQIANSQVIAACEGAIEADAKEIWVQDAHWTGRNIDPGLMPAGVRLVRGFSKSPNDMIALVDKTFDGVAFIGVHSESGSAKNVLGHCYSNDTVDFIKINGKIMTETEINSKLAAYYGVPTILVAGDQGVTQNFPDDVVKVITTSCFGGSTVMMKSIQESNAEIKDGMNAAVKQISSIKIPPLEKKFELEIKYRLHADAFKAGFYPNAKITDDTTVKFSCEDYYEIMRALLFLIEL